MTKRWNEIKRLVSADEQNTDSKLLSLTTISSFTTKVYIGFDNELHILSACKLPL